MIVIGLTGSIGMGKSTVAAMFRAEGVPVFDADAAVHELQGPDGPLVPLIEALFPGTTTARGVDRGRLGEAVLGNPAQLALLEGLVHPAVARLRATFLRHHRSRQLVVLDVPLLFETGGWRMVDHVVVVSAPVWKQRRRVLARPGMTGTKLARILARQWPDHAKRRLADTIIPTGGSLTDTRAAVRRLVACLRSRAAR